MDSVPNGAKDLRFLDKLKNITSKSFFSSSQKADKIYEEKFDDSDIEAKEQVHEQVIVDEELSKVDTNSKEAETSDVAPHQPAASRFTEDDIEAILPSSNADEDMPALTLRMWLLSFGLGAVVAGTDSFFGLRFPKVKISVVVILLVAWPLGCLWHWIIPSWQIKLPRFLGGGFNLNPGPFNYKEHACVYIFTNVVCSAGIVLDTCIQDSMMFKKNIGIPRQILWNLATHFVSFSLLGLFRDVLVTPEDRIWPGVLNTIALFKAIYSKDNPIANGWRISRWAFLMIIFIGSMIWYWFPDFIMPFTSTIGAWITWIKPESHALSQVFGVKSGLGLFPLTFDWTQVTSLNNPLTTPFWAVASMFGSFVFWIWIVMPGLYYQNWWQTAHFPIMTNKVYTRDKKPYDFKKVTDDKWVFSLEKYENYSQPMLPIALIMNLCLGIAAFTALAVNFILTFKDDVIVPYRTRSKMTDRFNRMNQLYKPFPYWVYGIPLIIGLALGFAFSEGFRDSTGDNDSPIGAGGYIVGNILGAAMYIPMFLVESRANTRITIAVFYYVVCGNWFTGRPRELLYFWSTSFGIIQHGLHMAQGAKVGHYLRIKPKEYMVVIFLSCVWVSLVTPAVSGWLAYNIKNLCTSEAENNMTCRTQRTQFNLQAMWGLFADKMFAPGGRYSWIMWFFLVGGGTAIVQWVMMKWRGKRSIWASFDPVLFFGGAENIPSVTGYNYSTWFFAAFVFNFLIHGKYTAWWRKYNLVTSIGLDCGVAVTIILVYFTLFWIKTGNPQEIVGHRFNWWGTEVGKTYWNGKERVKTCDAKGCPHLNGPIEPPKHLF